MDCSEMYDETFFEKWLSKREVCRQIVDSMCDLIVFLDAAGRVVYSVSTSDRYEHPAPSSDYYANVYPDNLLDFLRTLQGIEQGDQPRSLLYRYRSANDSWRWHESIGLAVHNDNGEKVYSVLLTKDITYKKEEEENLRQLAFHDALTGLPNRRIFHEHVRQSLAQSKRTGQSLALLSIDVDDFKRINDSMGHHVGDQFLISLAKRVRSCIREVDMFARISGDEFMVLLPAVDSEEGTEKVSKRILEAVSAPWKVESHTFHASISIGIALSPKNGSDMDTLFKQVDSALYQAKHQGKQGFAFFQGE